ncbi:hypothetical protein M758_UG000200 [Ceratodon purpureus]|nr:hypothetical protein M758_UG000200 [Ceratodon purpureus]
MSSSDSMLLNTSSKSPQFQTLTMFLCSSSRQKPVRSNVCGLHPSMAVTTLQSNICSNVESVTICLRRRRGRTRRMNQPFPSFLYPSPPPAIHYTLCCDISDPCLACFGRKRIFVFLFATSLSAFPPK